MSCASPNLDDDNDEVVGYVNLLGLPADKHGDPTLFDIKLVNHIKTEFTPQDVEMSKAGLLTNDELEYIEQFLTNLPEQTLSETNQEQKSATARRKKERHLVSEHKRRNGIKRELDRMSKLLPGIQHLLATRPFTRIPQSKLLAHANDHIERLQAEIERLKFLAKKELVTNKVD